MTTSDSYDLRLPIRYILLQNDWGWKWNGCSISRNCDKNDGEAHGAL